MTHRVPRLGPCLLALCQSNCLLEMYCYPIRKTKCCPNPPPTSEHIVIFNKTRLSVGNTHFTMVFLLFLVNAKQQYTFSNGFFGFPGFSETMAGLLRICRSLYTVSSTIPSSLKWLLIPGHMLSILKTSHSPQTDNQ